MSLTFFRLISLKLLKDSMGTSLKRQRRKETLKALLGLSSALSVMVLGTHTTQAVSRTTGIITASVAVVQKCNLYSSGGLVLDMATEKMSSPQSLQVTLMCSRAERGISIDINFANTPTFEPFMKNESGKIIPYRVYLDPEFTIPYKASPYTTLSVESQIPMPINIYVRILPSIEHPIPEGIYTDSMKLTVTF